MDNKKHKIRAVRLSDAAAIATIYRHYVEQTTVSFEMVAPTVEEMAERIRTISAHHPYFVCEQDGRILGYCYVHPWKDREAYCHSMETTIYLVPEAKGQGIGTQLMRALLDECRKRDYRALIACITAENAASVAFHKRFGFEQASLFKQVGQKFGRWLDVVDYELLL